MNDDPNKAFIEERKNAIKAMQSDPEVKDLSKKWFDKTYAHKYSYNFSWMGRPIIQYPQDLVAMQEIIWKVKPDLIIETGIAHGGSIIYYASLLEMLGNNGSVLGIDIDIRSHNRSAIEAHPMFKRIKLIQGSSIDEQIAEKVCEEAKNANNPMVILDSNHTEDHVLQELALYSPLVKKNSYLVVFDTIVEDLPEDTFPDRPWSIGNNPKTAVHKFLSSNDRFEIDQEIQDKLLLSVAPNGYLRCIK